MFRTREAFLLDTMPQGNLKTYIPMTRPVTREWFFKVFVLEQRRGDFSSRNLVKNEVSVRMDGQNENGCGKSRQADYKSMHE